ncbi:MAG TPA: GNAT family N-acetyltransferase [Cyclobacteriaceae bacterium]|nr:GNAT family N-acetyltransferase [Cyclobacteriaceae bacterium]
MIETERFLLKPLTYELLVKYVAVDNSLERELNVRDSLRTISPELKEALEQTIMPNVADKSKNYLYSTLWTAILKAEQIMVGDLCIVGEPNEEGQIEIGYGIYEEFRGKGYMTEIVSGIVTWAKDQEKVKSIFASTDKGNIASSTVLIKNNFIKVSESDTSLSWLLKLES